MKNTYYLGTMELVPDSVHGEFAIVGVFCVNVVKGDLLYRLLPPDNIQRVTAFFPQLKSEVFKGAMETLHKEWERYSHEEFPDQEMKGRAIFHSLTTPTESMIRHTAKGTALVENPEMWLDQKYNELVLKNKDLLVA